MAARRLLRPPPPSPAAAQPLGPGHENQVAATRGHVQGSSGRPHTRPENSPVGGPLADGMGQGVPQRLSLQPGEERGGRGNRRWGNRIPRCGIHILHFGESSETCGTMRLNVPHRPPEGSGGAKCHPGVQQPSWTPSPAPPPPPQRLPGSLEQPCEVGAISQG